MSFVHIHTLVILPGVPFNVAPKHFYQDPRLSENKRKQNYCTKAENNGFFLILSTIKGQHVCFKLDEVQWSHTLTFEVEYHSYCSHYTYSLEITHLYRGWFIIFETSSKALMYFVGISFHNGVLKEALYFLKTLPSQLLFMCFLCIKKVPISSSCNHVKSVVC